MVTKKVSQSKTRWRINYFTNTWGPKARAVDQKERGGTKCQNISHGNVSKSPPPLLFFLVAWVLERRGPTQGLRCCEKKQAWGTHFRRGLGRPKVKEPKKVASSFFSLFFFPSPISSSPLLDLRGKMDIGSSPSQSDSTTRTGKEGEKKGYWLIQRDIVLLLYTAPVSV